MANRGAERLDGPLLHSTISWARERSKARALSAWRREWASLPHDNLAAAALRDTPPSNRLAKFHREFTGERHIQTRIIQTMLGHGFRGDYYARFVPSESPACPCGTAPIQTRDHILSECPLYEHGRHHLRAVSPSLSTPIILGTHAGLKALSLFISTTNAFAKATPEPAVEH